MTTKNISLHARGTKYNLEPNTKQQYINFANHTPFGQIKYIPRYVGIFFAIDLNSL